MQQNSPKPYLLRALYEWCNDCGYTPYIVVRVDAHTRVPRAFVRNHEIILNISFDATSQLKMGNEWIEFSARFSAKSHKLEIPISNIAAIYARENGQGMSFPVETFSGSSDTDETAQHTRAQPHKVQHGEAPIRSNSEHTAEKKRRAHLKLIK